MQVQFQKSILLVVRYTIISHLSYNLGKKKNQVPYTRQTAQHQHNVQWYMLTFISLISIKHAFCFKVN